MGSASENRAAASPAGRHQQSLVIKLTVITADIKVMPGMVFKMGRQPVHQQGGNHARRHNPAESLINAVQRIVARVNHHQMVGDLLSEAFDALIQRPAFTLAFDQEQRDLFFLLSRETSLTVDISLTFSKAI